MKNNSTTARFLFLFAATALVLAAVAFSGARYEASHRLETLKTVQNGELELASNSIERDFASVFSDLYMLASNEDLLRYINNGTRIILDQDNNVDITRINGIKSILCIDMDILKRKQLKQYGKHYTVI